MEPQDNANENWDLSQERAFMENLFCQRFNFFILVFSLVLAGAASANTQLKLVSLLWIGLVLCILVGLTVYRNYVKLNWILEALHGLPSHPVARTEAGIKVLGKKKLFGVNPIIGIVIPSICCLVLLVAALCSSFSVFRAA